MDLVKLVILLKDTRKRSMKSKNMGRNTQPNCRAVKNNPQKVIEYANQSLQLYQDLEDLDGIAWSYDLIASAYYATDGSTRIYKEYTERRFAVLRRLGDRRSLAFALDAAGLTALEEFRLAEAIDLRKQAVAMLSEVGSQADLAGQLTSLAQTQTLCGLFQEAHENAAKALSIWQFLGDQGQSIFPMDDYYYSGVHLGIHTDVIEEFMKGIKLCESIQMMRWRARMNATLSMLFVANLEFSTAKIYLKKYLKQDTAFSKSVCALHNAINCYVEYHFQNAHGVKSSALQNMGIGLQINHRWMPLHSIPAIALVYANEGKHERAIELYTIAWRWQHIANSRWYEDVAGRKLAVFQATLPPALVDRARKKGEAVDIWEAVKELHKELQAEVTNEAQDGDNHIN